MAFSQTLIAQGVGGAPLVETQERLVCFSGSVGTPKSSARASLPRRSFIAAAGP
jgi:hypothetical protein